MEDYKVLKALFAMNGASWTGVMEKVGFSSYTSISDRLSGKKNMFVNTLIKLCDALDSDVVVRDRKTKTEFILTKNEALLKE